MAAAHDRRPLRISLIMPVLNEEHRICAQLDAIVALQGIQEVIVVDGGSLDRTVEFARSYRQVRVINAPKGRALQMNAGARTATGGIYLFLHADVGLPEDAARLIENAFADPRVVAGAFRTWTVSDKGKDWFTPFLHLADLRSRYTGLPYGDQAMFVRADAFQRVGGFPEQPILEDLELSRRLRRIGTIRTVRASVIVSGRRFLARPIYYTALVNLLPLLYRLGVPARRLASLYGHPR